MRSPFFAAHPVYLKHDPRQIWPERSIVLFPDLYLNDDFVHLNPTPFLEHGRYNFADHPDVVWRHHVECAKFARDHTGTGQVRHSHELGILGLKCGGGEGSAMAVVVQRNDGCAARLLTARVKAKTVNKAAD